MLICFRVDACQSKVEIVTPYWAANSAGKVRAIVNTQHFEQAVHQEVCSWVLGSLLLKKIFKKNKSNYFIIIITAKCRPADVRVIVAVNRNISGTDYLPTIQTMTAKEYSWIGFYFRRVVFADVIQLSLTLALNQ